MATYLLICSELAILYERHEKILFHILEFQIALGATCLDSQLAPSKFNPWGASGQLLISNTVAALTKAKTNLFSSILNIHDNL